MDFSTLKRNIIDVIYENQVKLGYQSETLHLYYPLISLNKYLNTSLNSEEMINQLTEFKKEVKDDFGNIEISFKQDRFCFRFPNTTAEFVHYTYDDGGFLTELIGTISDHNKKIEDIITVFYKYSDDVSIEKFNNSDFDYLVFFTKGIPNNYRYCFSIEGSHITYHRFTIQDFEAL